MKSRPAIAAAALCCLLANAAQASEMVYRSAGPGGLPHFTNAPAHPDARLWLVLEAPAPRAPALGRATQRRSAESCCGAELVAALRAAAASSGVDEALLRAVIHVESGFDRHALSPAGAAGLMQLMPAAAQRFGVKDRFDVRQNLDAGARYLRELLDLFGGDLHLALAAYNAGEGAVRRHGNRIPPYAETRRYVPAVLARYRAERERQRELQPVR